MSNRMKKFRDRSHRIDLLLDKSHMDMLTALTSAAGAPSASSTIRALIRREYGKTHVVESDRGPGKPGGNG